MRAAMVMAWWIVGCTEPGPDEPRQPEPGEQPTTDIPDPDAPDDEVATPPRPELGRYGGSLRDDLYALRAAFDEVDPPASTNVNDLAVAPGSLARAPILDALRPDRVEEQEISFAGLPPGEPRQPWNSYLGFQLATDYVLSSYQSNWPFPEGRQVCEPARFFSDCCSYDLTEGEQDSGETIRYYAPSELYATELDAEMALRQVYAQQPLYLPFVDDKVQLQHGWYYNNGNAHGSLDYGRDTQPGEDPAFVVRSIAPGTVVAKYWDDWHGNVLVIEHPPDPGSQFTYRSHYFHLRDGRIHDVFMALDRTEPTGDVTDQRDKYLLAALTYGDLRFWGTDDHEMLVDVGDDVYALEPLALSGNTGPGGAGAGLGLDGTPNDPTTMNNHLHFMLSVKHPLLTGNEWLYVDPFGVYGLQSSGCYDIVENGEFDRLFAPFYPRFHGVDLGVLNNYLYYYGQMGWSPTTLSIQWTGGGAVAAGAFDDTQGEGWALVNYASVTDFDDAFADLTSVGLRPLDRSVTLDATASPRHNAVYRPSTIGSWASYGRLELGVEYPDIFDARTGEGFALEDFFAYREGPVDRAVATFAPESEGQTAHHLWLSPVQFAGLANALADDGWLPVDVNVMETNAGVFLSGIFAPLGGQRMVHVAMSALEYQAWTQFYIAWGWDLEVVQSYAGGTQFAAIYAD